MEGAAARASFMVLVAVMPARLGFTSRQRRPPPDPVNAALSIVLNRLWRLLKQREVD